MNANHTTFTTPQTNAEGFVIFNSRNWSYAGSRRTWARYDAATDRLTIQLANTGVINDEYLADLKALAEEWGIDWASLRSGDRVTVDRPTHDNDEDTTAETAEVPAELDGYDIAVDGVLDFDERNVCNMGDAQLYAHYNAAIRTLTIYKIGAAEPTPAYKTVIIRLCHRVGLDYNDLAPGSSISKTFDAPKGDDADQYIYTSYNPATRATTVLVRVDINQLSESQQATVEEMAAKWGITPNLIRPGNTFVLVDPEDY